MRNLSLSLVALVAAATFAPAQNIVCPDIYANVGGAGTSAFVWRNTPVYCQQLYMSDHFTGRGIDYPISITRLRWRSNTVGAAGSYSNVAVRMSTSASDWINMSTTFATNKGPNDIEVYNGVVNVAQGNGLSPGNYVVDITLTTPFVYNPLAGNLLIEFASQAGPTLPNGNLPQIDCAANQGNNARARRLSNGTYTDPANPGTTVGALSFFAPVISIDFQDPAGLARRTPYGQGCYHRPLSFYENFAAGTFDLGSATGGTTGFTLTPVGNGGYVALPGVTGWYTPTSGDLGLLDDSVSPPQALPFTFPYTGGTTTALEIGSNGSIWMQTGGTTDPGADPAALLAQGARFVPLWTDHNPAALDPTTNLPYGSIHFDVDPSNQTVYVTWLGVPLWEGTQTNTYLSTFQVAFHQSGQVEYRYRGCNPALYQALVGWSPGGNVSDPGSRDISATLPFSTGDGNLPLTLNVPQRPVLGTTVNLTTTNVPNGTLVGGQVMSFTQYNPGLPLTALGADGCFQYVGADVSHLLLPSGPTVVFSFALPNNPALSGLVAYTQTATFSAGFNALGVIFSNGLRLELGTL